MKHLIHYSDWNKNWAGWVPESRVLKYAEAVRASESQPEQYVEGIRRGVALGKKTFPSATEICQHENKEQAESTWEWRWWQHRETLSLLGKKGPTEILLLKMKKHSWTEWKVK